MVKIRSIDTIGAKWAKVTPDRAPYYESGVKDPKADWAIESKKAEPTYEAGVRDGITNKMYGKGVAARGTPGWQEKTTKKGPGRFSEGVGLAEPDYKTKFAPYRDDMERLSLPMKGARGSAGNYARVKAIGDAFHAKRIGKPVGATPTA